MIANPPPETGSRSASADKPSVRQRLNDWLRENRTGLLILPAVAVAIYGWMWWKGRSAPQRLGDMPDQNLLGFHGGEMILEQRQGDITARQPPSGPSRALLSLPVRPSVQAVGPYAQPLDSTTSKPVSGIQVTDQSILYYVEDRPRPPQKPAGIMGGMAGMVAGRPVRFRYRAASLKEMGAARVEVAESASYSLFVQPYEPRARPWRAASGLDAPSATVAGDTSYWVEHRYWTNVPKNLLQQRDGNDVLISVFPPCSLLKRARAGGPTETVLKTAVYGVTALGRSGVCWIEPSARNGDPSRDLYYLRNDRSRPAKLVDYKGSGLPVECGDRLYWLQGADILGSTIPATPHTVQLMSAARDLSSTWTEATLILQGRMVSLAGNGVLFAHGPALYALCLGDARLAEDPAYRPERRDENAEIPTALFSITLRPRIAVRKLATFPRGAYVFYRDGGDLYTVISEQRENWFDWSKSGLIPKTAKVLYRYRLPN